MTSMKHNDTLLNKMTYRVADRRKMNSPREDAVRQLKSIAKKARNLGHHTVADNAILEVVSDCDNTEEKLRMLRDVKSRRDLRYNFVRATIRRVETLIDAGRQAELTPVDRDDLWFSYQLAYSQRLAAVFDRCHRVLWKYLVATNSKEQLGDLYMYSSFFWRLCGESEEELDYSLKLQSEVAKKSIGSPILNAIVYLNRRISALTR